MAYAIVLATIILFAITAFAHGLCQTSLLVLPDLFSFLSLVIETAGALTHARRARHPRLEANTVQLTTVTPFAVASSSVGQAFRSIYRWVIFRHSQSNASRIFESILIFFLVNLCHYKRHGLCFALVDSKDVLGDD